MTSFRFQVLVGNIGSVYIGNDKGLAVSTFREYADQSKNNYGRAAGESVTLFDRDEITKEVEKKS